MKMTGAYQNQSLIAGAHRCVNLRPGTQYVCAGCCSRMRLEVNEHGYCVTVCDAGHPQIMIREGKVFATSA